jgi:putative hydrolases of HD superfamily
MFSNRLLTEFKDAGFSGDDNAFLEEMFERFPDVGAGFENFADVFPIHRPIMSMIVAKETLRAGWRRIGVPEHDIQTIADHQGTCAIVSTVLGMGMHATRILINHDMSETVVTDFTPHDPITAPEKHRLERLGLEFLLVAAPAREETLALWEEYEAQETPESHAAADIDRLEMILQAQIYEERYPELKEKLGEFWSYVDSRLKTDKGRTLFDTLKANHPQPHPLKLHLASPHKRAWMDKAPESP